METKVVDTFSGFSKLSREQKFQKLMELGIFTQSDIEYLQSGGIQDLELAENFIENPIGYFQLPMGVATNFKIDGVEYVIPMAVEETSIIAAASKTAKWIKQEGNIETEVIGEDILGQIQIAHVKDVIRLKEVVANNKKNWIEELNLEVAQGMYKRGGGVTDINLRIMSRPDGDELMAIIHVHMNPCDAMGANVINQVCEYLKSPVEEKTGETVTMCILTNLVDSRLTKATVTLNNVDEELGYKIQEASIFAENDSYRAATNNKGVLNGIDPILIATGNDWRAVEAGVHSFACRDGKYRSITEWRYNFKTKKLVGKFIAPLIAGTVGGVTRLHPTARLALRMMKIESALHLSRICAAVGLVQNLGALKALTTVGIIEGHMKLHIRNLALGAGAKESERPTLQKRLEQLLLTKKRISLSDAIQILKKIRDSVSPATNVSTER